MRIRSNFDKVFSAADQPNLSFKNEKNKTIKKQFQRPLSPKDIDEWMWKPAWIPPPHFGELTGDRFVLTCV